MILDRVALSGVSFVSSFDPLFDARCLVVFYYKITRQPFWGEVYEYFEKNYPGGPVCRFSW